MRYGDNITQIVKSPQHCMGTSKPTRNDGQPADNQPRRYQTIRIHLNRCPIETTMPHQPISITQKQGSNYSPNCVLKIRYQLNRQQRKTPIALPAQKTGDGNPLLAKLRKQLDGIPKVWGNLSVAVYIVADRTL